MEIWVQGIRGERTSSLVLVSSSISRMMDNAEFLLGRSLEKGDMIHKKYDNGERQSYIVEE